LQGYRDELISADEQGSLPLQLHGKADVLFGNLEELHRFHSDIFLRDLENCITTPELVGLCFVQRVSTKAISNRENCSNTPTNAEDI
jgi:hypothetical protein